MRSLHFYVFLLAFLAIFNVSVESAPERFLSFSKAELCSAEPHLAVCQPKKAQSSKIINGDGLTPQRLEELSMHTRDGFIEEEANNGRGVAGAEETDQNPFDDVATRPPIEFQQYGGQRPKSRRKYGRRRGSKYRSQYSDQNYYQRRVDPALYRVYPGLHPKDQTFCPNMRGMFAYTCAPSKPLRLDLVEFCKDYAAFCNVPNFHRLPGPRMGPPLTDKSTGHIDVNGHFGFGIGAVPGMEVGVGWGVDVGPLPIGESVGVGVGLDLGIMGSKTPEAFRRGQDDPNARGGGIVGINGGVGVKAPGTGDGVGVGSGLGVGK